MNSEKKIGINALLNVIRQSLSVIFPLITVPYAIKVIGVSNLGKINYSNSIISYFSLFAMLGISQYAIREGSKIRKQKAEFCRFANEILTINIFTTFVAYAALLYCVFSIKKLSDYRIVLLIQSASIILTTVGMDWINTVYEDFLLITVRSIASYLVMILLLFTCVHDANDYLLYASLPVVANAIICITNLIHCRRYFQIRPSLHLPLKGHIRPILVFFANSLAVSLYVSIDITMLGWFHGDYAVGLYSLAVKVYHAVKSLMTAIYNVSISRLAYLWGNHYVDEFKNLMTNLFGYITVLLVPATVGLFMISKEIMILLGGEEYVEAVFALRTLSIALLFAIYGGLVCDCLNVSIGREKENLIATIWAAIINIGLNLFLIPKYSLNGAAVTTLLAEGFVTIYCFVRIPNKKNYVDSHQIKKTFINTVIGSLLMILISVILRQFITSYFWVLIAILITSVVVYSLFMMMIKDYYFCNVSRNLLKKIINKY